MPVHNLAPLSINDNDIAVERFDSAGNPDFVLQRYGYGFLFSLVRFQHVVEQMYVHVDLRYYCLSIDRGNSMLIVEMLYPVLSEEERKIIICFYRCLDALTIHKVQRENLVFPDGLIEKFLLDIWFRARKRAQGVFFWRNHEHGRKQEPSEGDAVP